MPRMTASSEELKSLPAMVEGMVTVRLDGFKPAYSKNKDSVNLSPIMKVINHPEYNDRRVFDNLNTKAKWIWKDFCHGFGVPMIEDASGDFEFPGQWAGDDPDPEKWGDYAGPLLGQTAQVYIIQQAGFNGGPVRNAIKYYVCSVQGCAEKHSQNLAK